MTGGPGRRDAAGFRPLTGAGRIVAAGFSRRSGASRVVAKGACLRSSAFRAVAAGFSLRLSRAQYTILAILPVVLFSIVSSASGAPDSLPPDLIPVKELIIPGNAGWVDTGIDVEEDQEFLFRSEGEISLQKGNPDAACGPDGADIQGLQQPLPDRNMGCLAGKVSRVLAVRTDEKTGEEVRDEFVRYFFIGRELVVVMPIRGRLYVGVNENVVRDNDGEFRVAIFKRAP